MKRAPNCSTQQWEKDSKLRDDIMKRNGGFEGLKVAKEYVEKIFGSRCNLSYLQKRIKELGLHPCRIANRMKDMLILWIYKNKDSIEKAIAMEREKNLYCIFNSFNDLEVQI